MMLAKRLFSSTPIGSQTSRDVFKAALGQQVARAAVAAPAFPIGAEKTGSSRQVGQRKFDPNQVIQPHDLSQSGLFARSRPTRPPLLGPKARDAKKIDPFYLSGTNPLDMTYHPRLVNAFTNQLGRIRSRAETGLTWKSQRMMGKLIRRQRAMGLVPKWSNEAVKGGYGYVAKSFHP